MDLEVIWIRVLIFCCMRSWLAIIEVVIILLKIVNQNKIEEMEILKETCILLITQMISLIMK